QGDAHILWKIEATRALPLSNRACERGTRERKKSLTQIGLPSGTDGKGLIPLLGEDFNDLIAVSARLDRISAGCGLLEAYVGTAVLVCLGYAIALLGAGYRVGPAAIVLALCGVGIYTERNSVRITSTTVVSNSLMPALLGATLFGPIAGMLVAAAPNV